MNVFRGVRVQMMMTMNRGPPNCTSLSRCLTQECNEELHDSAGLIRPVTEVPVVSCCDCPHTNEVERHRNPYSLQGHSSPYRSKTSQMDENKWDRGRVDDIVLRRVGVVAGHSLSSGQKMSKGAQQRPNVMKDRQVAKD